MNGPKFGIVRVMLTIYMNVRNVSMKVYNNSRQNILQNRARGEVNMNMDVVQQLYKAPSDTVTPQPSETMTTQPSETIATQPSVTMTTQPSVTMTTQHSVTMTTQPPPPSAETFSAWDQDPDMMQPRSDIKIIPINSVGYLGKRSRSCNRLRTA